MAPPRDEEVPPPGPENEPEADAPGSEQHPFARFVSTVGRGAKLARALGAEEAQEAMRMILAGAVEPVQLGAFLIVLRYRKETPEELAGFVRAARGTFVSPMGARAELDWPSYADRHQQLPYFLLAALLLAHGGARVLMHGIAGAGPGSTRRQLRALGIPPCSSLAEAAATIEATGFAYVPLESFCPALGRLFALRPLLGLRSPANTYARELNPFAAPFQIQGVFHPNYVETHRAAARLLGQPNAAIFKGGGGEVQRNPEKPCRVATLSAGVAGEELWPALAPGTKHPWRGEPLEAGRLLALWRGEWGAPLPEAAIVGTAAIALRLLGRAPTPDAAEAEARAMWAARPRDAFDRPRPAAR